MDRTPMDNASSWTIFARVPRRSSKSRKFLNLCKTPSLPVKSLYNPWRFPLDAAIVFSDILTIPDAMGLGYFIEGEGLFLKDRCVLNMISGIYAFPTLKSV